MVLPYNAELQRKMLPMTLHLITEPLLLIEMLLGLGFAWMREVPLPALKLAHSLIQCFVRLALLEEPFKELLRD